MNIISQNFLEIIIRNAVEGNCSQVAGKDKWRSPFRTYFRGRNVHTRILWLSMGKTTVVTTRNCWTRVTKSSLYYLSFSRVRENVIRATLGLIRAGPAALWHIPSCLYYLGFSGVGENVIGATLGLIRAGPAALWHTPSCQWGKRRTLSEKRANAGTTNNDWTIKHYSWNIIKHYENIQTLFIKFGFFVKTFSSDLALFIRFN